ncbi:hypothetical protein WR25_21621 [Diploscapter pachys]|uniref:Protein sleepless n=1 Tax=Diploscapter pachys TaxID=2018661 RepID=A0A2A2LXF3_9BILA|nr:hypothetical protein WR25_21621 [Diploscapter pachys]
MEHRSLGAVPFSFSSSPSFASPSSIPSSSFSTSYRRISSSLLRCLLFVTLLHGVSSIGCFVCSSFDGENASCEDPFNSTADLGSKERETASISSYHYPCLAVRKSRSGLFPADHCIKINGYRANNTSKTLVIRTCALDSGTLTADTEIVRISHCGHFKFEGHHYTGCVQSCETDGCNSAPSLLSPSLLILLCAFVSMFLFQFLTS